MPWYKGLWVDHVVTSHDDVLAFNAAMSGDLPHEAVVEFDEPGLTADPAIPDPPVDDSSPPAEPEPEPEPAVEDSAPVVDPVTAEPVAADPVADLAPVVEEPAALTPEQKAAELESKHSKAELAAMAEGLGIETKGMNKGQIAAVIAQASIVA